jgi:predicted DNA-binding protein (UPF0251 family)
MPIIDCRRINMVRPKCPRNVSCSPEKVYFKPRGIPVSILDEVVLTVDELESIRLADFDSLYQEKAAERMHISRQTFGRILDSAHKKIADALINGKAIKIGGGVIKMAGTRKFKCDDCSHEWELPFGTGRQEACPECGSKNIHRAEQDRGPHRHGWKCGCLSDEK